MERNIPYFIQTIMKAKQKRKKCIADLFTNHRYMDTTLAKKYINFKATL
jgi:hypothetical protein